MRAVEVLVARTATNARITRATLDHGRDVRVPATTAVPT
jgi:hypothetical protein